MIIIWQSIDHSPKVKIDELNTLHLFQQWRETISDVAFSRWPCALAEAAAAAAAGKKSLLLRREDGKKPEYK